MVKSHGTDIFTNENEMIEYYVASSKCLLELALPASKLVEHMYGGEYAKTTRLSTLINFTDCTTSPIPLHHP